MLGTFLLCLAFFSVAGWLAAHYLWRIPQRQEEERLNVRMRELHARAAVQRQRTGGDLLRRESVGTFSFATFLDWVKPLKRLQQIIEQANLKYRATDVFTVSVILFVLIFALTGLFIGYWPIKLAFASVVAAIPTDISESRMATKARPVGERNRFRMAKVAMMLMTRHRK